MRAIPISSAGGPRVILRALRDAGEYLDKGELVCIFPEGQLTRTGTLQPFQRGSHQGEGYGLGLAVVSALVEGQGGWLECDSAPGRGTCFQVFLPTDE